MEAKKAPKRSRAERGCISRTFKRVVVDAAIYDRTKKKEVRKTCVYTGTAAEMTTEKLIKNLRNKISAEMINAILLDFDIVSTAEVRYILSEADFLKYAKEVES